MRAGGSSTIHGFKRAGQVRFWGFTGLGETGAMLDVIEHGGFAVVQCYFDALNPSAGYAAPPTCPKS